MDYKNVECPVCKKAFNDNDDIVVCPVCGTPHHRECYNLSGRCANEGRHAEGFEFKAPAVELPDMLSWGSLPFGERKTPDTQNEDEAENASSPFGVSFGVDFGNNTEVDGIPLNEVQQFVGRDSFSSKLVLNLTLTDKLKRLRPNIAAFFLPYIWLFYRKMYKLGALFVILSLLTTVAFTNRNTINYTKKLFNAYMTAFSEEESVEQFNARVDEIQQEGTGNNYFYDAAPQLLSLVLRLVVALFANKWYLQHMKKQVMKTREECSSMDEYMAALTVRGGKSIAAAIASVVIFGAVSVLYQLALIQLF